MSSLYLTKSFAYAEDSELTTFTAEDWALTNIWMLRWTLSSRPLHTTQQSLFMPHLMSVVKPKPGELFPPCNVPFFSNSPKQQPSFVFSKIETD